MKQIEHQPEEILHQDFICAWDNVFQPEFCEWLVDYLDRTDVLRPRNYAFISDKQTDMSNFSPGEADYLMQGVNYCANQYMEKYPYLQTSCYHSSCVLLQKTEPMGGYHSFHAEDTTWNTQGRTLAWMVYLNDVDEGGETEFLYQQLKIKPVTGRVVIWPGSFTHLHRGNPPMSNKYIATGWYAASQGIESKKFCPKNTPS